MRPRPADNGPMSLQKRALVWVLAAAFASAMAVRPAKASDTSDAAPFMIMAAAFTATCILLAINFPSSDDTKKTDSTTPAPTGSSTSPLRRAPGSRAPGGAPPMLGFRGHF